MSTEQQIASVLIGWVLIALSLGSAWLVHWTDRKHAEKERRSRSE